MLDMDEVRRKAELLGYPCTVPLVEVLGSKGKSPTGVYSELRAHSEHSFLLESAIVGEKIARYSFLGAMPEKIVEVKGGRVKVNGIEEKLDGDPLSYLKKELDFRVEGGDLPKFFGGLVGFFGYDYVRHFEDIGTSGRDDLGHSDLYFFLVKDAIVFDHFREEVLLISNLLLHSEKDIEDEYSRAVEKIGFLREVVMSSQKVEVERNGARRGFESNFTREEFMHAVERAKQYIHEGEIFQVVLSQRFSCDFTGDAFEVYLALKEINPSPYMYCFESGDLRIVGSSPEILVKSDGRRVTVRPIAGTRARGKNVVEDEALSRDMANDEKERAEHVMLVDLGRNDVGKVAEFGSVKLTDFMAVERYSHVQHLVSNVTGELGEGRDALDALEAAFPAGTVSGAPKVRAMQIIEELEPTRRGVYAGALGYFSLAKDMDFAITIRTVVLQSGKAYFQAGAGIVADSVAEKEYEETVNKGRAMLKALEMVGGAVKPAFRPTREGSL